VYSKLESVPFTSFDEDHFSHSTRDMTFGCLTCVHKLASSQLSSAIAEMAAQCCNGQIIAFE